MRPLAPEPGATTFCASVDHATEPADDKSLFNLTIVEFDPATKAGLASERFLNVSIEPTAPDTCHAYWRGQHLCKGRQRREWQMDGAGHQAQEDGGVP